METAVENKSSSSCGYKLVPWLGWDEWEFVRESLFSSSPDSVASALNRIAAWRSRGCLPVVIEVTASVIEIQQKDPSFRLDDTVDNLLSEEMLAMLHCMAIMRLVNGVVEKTRKQKEISIADAADMIGIPRMLIDLRHEGSHRDLPSLRLLRIASRKALDWLKSYYWEPQKETNLRQGDGIAEIKNEIKAKLHELIFRLKVKASPESSPSKIKGKRSKKQIMKTMKTLIRLYSSYSSELVSVLLEYLLKASDSVDPVEVSKSSPGGPNIDNPKTVSDDWKLMMLKFAKKEPKLILDLLKAVLDMIQIQKNNEYEMGEQDLTPMYHKYENRQIERLSSLFAWLVCVCKVLKPYRKKDCPDENEDCLADRFAPKATLESLIHKCLLVLTPGSEHLIGSARNLARMAGNKHLLKKLKKLAFLSSSNIDMIGESPSVLRPEDLILHENDLRQAEVNLSVLKLRKANDKLANTTASEHEIGKNSKWVVAKSWNTCPIGMLPTTVGSSGRLPPPINSHKYHDCKTVTEPTPTKEFPELNQFGKREATRDTDNLNVKKMKETALELKESEGETEGETEGEQRLSDGVKGKLLIDGIWRNVKEEELIAIRSDIRILVV